VLFWHIYFYLTYAYVHIYIYSILVLMYSWCDVFQDFINLINVDVDVDVSYKKNQVGEIVAYNILHTVYWLSNVLEYFPQYFPVLLNVVSAKGFLN